MDINNMDAEDFLNLYCFTKTCDKPIYKDYRDNFKPTVRDIKNYNAKVHEMKRLWCKDKTLIHKFIRLNELPKEIKKDNDFEYCAEIGHKFELWVENELKGFGVDLGMYYDDRQFQGENVLGLEIKHDSKLAETGNVYIEYEALNRNESEFIKGGILKDDNSKYWLIGTEKEYYTFYKDDLLRIYNNVMSGKREWGCKKAERRTSKGIIISRERCKDIMIADNLVEFLVKTGLLDG